MKRADFRQPVPEINVRKSKFPCPECDGEGTAWGSLCGFCGGTGRI
jgi:DnaJ-class molecular chaperone